jgi:hypothetical protein
MKMSALFRSVIALSALVVTAACSGAVAPTSPSEGLTAGVSSSSAATDAQGGSLSGTAYFDPFSTGGFPDATENGVTGRNVVLHGDIEGTNFEPGICHPGVDSIFGLHCFLFGDGEGQFTRLAPGGVAFTTCHCTVAGVGGPGDQVTLKISYPPATPIQYPNGFTKFAFQAGTGALAKLSGQGTLDFGGFPQASFSYRFAGKL